MGEIRVMREGSLWLVQASGANPTGWQTGANPPSALLGFVQSFGFTSAMNLVTPTDRGIPMHHKDAGRNPIDVNVQFLWTGTFPQAASAAGGGTMPIWHVEYKATEREAGAGSARYYQFFGVAQQQMQFTENAEGDTIALTFRALAMSGANTTGYMP